MDVTKLEGIVDAIESESKMPSPSHQNLARLTGMFMRELIEGYKVLNVLEPKAEVTTTANEAESNIIEVDVRPKRRLKNSKE